MTASRIRGSQRIRSNAERGKEQLQGFEAFCEDFHGKMCLIGVSHQHTEGGHYNIGPH